jgi:hypothetical protein
MPFYFDILRPLALIVLFVVHRVGERGELGAEQAEHVR